MTASHLTSLRNLSLIAFSEFTLSSTSNSPGKEHLFLAQRVNGIGVGHPPRVDEDSGPGDHQCCGARTSEIKRAQGDAKVNQEGLRRCRSPRNELRKLLPPQSFPAYCHPLSQARQELPRLRLPRRCNSMVDFVSLGPSCRWRVSGCRPIPLEHGPVSRT